MTKKAKEELRVTTDFSPPAINAIRRSVLEGLYAEREAADAQVAAAITLQHDIGQNRPTNYVNAKITDTDLARQHDLAQETPTNNINGNITDHDFAHQSNCHPTPSSSKTCADLGEDLWSRHRGE